jgi:hypothetical protein
MDKTVFAYILSFIGFVLVPKAVALLLYIINNQYCSIANWVILTGVLATNVMYVIALDLITKIKNDRARYGSYVFLITPLMLEVAACIGYRYDCSNGTFLWWPCLSGLILVLHVGSMIFNLRFYTRDISQV